MNQAMTANDWQYANLGQRQELSKAAELLGRLEASPLIHFYMVNIAFTNSLTRIDKLAVFSLFCPSVFWLFAKEYSIAPRECKTLIVGRIGKEGLESKHILRKSESLAISPRLKYRTKLFSRK